MEKAFVELAQGFADAREFEAGVLSVLGREVGFEVGFFSVKGREAEPTVVGLGPATIERAVAGAQTYGGELLPVKRAALAARGVAVDTDVLGERGVRRTRYFNELAATVGGRHSLMAYVPFRGRVVAGVMLGRTGGRFSASEIERVEGVLGTVGALRGSYGYPVSFEPLPRASRRTLLDRVLPGRRLGAISTSGASIEVRDRDGFREMVASGGRSELVWTRANVEDPARSGWPYVELFHVAAGLAKQRERALFVGCGGAVAVRQFARAYPGISMDVVEREPAVVELARVWYALDSIPRVRVHVDDGADFVERAAPASWDVAVIDAYDAETCSVRFAGRAFFAALRAALRPGGTAAFNVIGALGSEALRGIVNAARGELDDVRLVPVVTAEESYSPDTPRNVVVIGVRRA